MCIIMCTFILYVTSFVLPVKTIMIIMIDYKNKKC